MRTIIGFIMVPAVALVGCAGAHSTQSTQVARADCRGLEANEQVAALLAPGSVSNVQPVYRRSYPHRDVQPREIAGASMFVRAEPGMHPAYLERALSCHAASRTDALATANSPLRVEGVDDVDVSRAGPHVRVAITGADRRAADTILQRARSLEAPAGHVHVEQIAGVHKEAL